MLGATGVANVRRLPVDAGVGSTVRLEAPRNAPPSASPLLDVRGLGVSFPIWRGLLHRAAGAFVVVDEVSFAIALGQTPALFEESPCGQTTTGRAVVQLLRAQAVVTGEAQFSGAVGSRSKARPRAPRVATSRSFFGIRAHRRTRACAQPKL